MAISGEVMRKKFLQGRQFRREQKISSMKFQ